MSEHRVTENETNSFCSMLCRGIRRTLEVACVLLLAVGLSGCSSGTESKDVFEVEFGMITSYSSYGVAINQEMARLCDSVTGEKVVICSKPDCRHIQKKDCDGYIGVFSERLFLTDKYELYVKRPAMEGEMSGNFNDVEVWRADLDGRNRKLLTTMENVQLSISAAYADGKFVYCYRESNADEVSPNKSFEELDMFRAGVYLIDVESGDKLLVDSREGYGTSFSNAIMTGGKMCYVVLYEDKKRDFELGPSIDWDKEYAFRKENRHMEIYCYDMVTGTNSLVWEGLGKEVHQYGRGYLICLGGGDRSGYLRVITDGQIRELKNEQSIKDIIGSYGYTGSYIYDDRIYMFCDGKVTVYNISTGETGPLADGRLDDKELRTIEAITGDRLYYSSMAGGEYHIYSVDRDSFFKGDLSKAMKME